MLSKSTGTYFKCSSIIPWNMFKIGMMFPTGNVSPSLWKMSPRKCRLIVMPAKLPACRPLTVTTVTSLRIANKMDKCTALVFLDTLALAIIVDGFNWRLMAEWQFSISEKFQISKKQMASWSICLIPFCCFLNSFWLVLHALSFLWRISNSNMFWCRHTLPKILVCSHLFFDFFLRRNFAYCHLFVNFTVCSYYPGFTDLTCISLRFPGQGPMCVR